MKLLLTFLGTTSHTNLLVNMRGKKITLHSVNHLNLQEVSCPKSRNCINIKTHIVKENQHLKIGFFTPKVGKEIDIPEFPRTNILRTEDELYLKLRSEVQRERKI